MRFFFFVLVGASLLFAAAAAARAETASCAGTMDRPPERLWLTRIGDPRWAEFTIDVLAVAADGSALAFGKAAKPGKTDVGDPRTAVVALASADGARSALREIGLPTLPDRYPSDRDDFAAALALPDGDVLAVIVARRKDDYAYRLVRFAPDGGVRAHRDLLGQKYELHGVRLVADGSDRVAILGSAGDAPLVRGVFMSFDFQLNLLVRYDQPERTYATSVFVAFQRRGARGYLLLGDRTGGLGRPAPPGVGRFSLTVDGRGGAVGRRRLGPPLQDWYATGAAFDWRGQIALIATFLYPNDKGRQLTWIVEGGNIARAFKVPEWQPPGEDFHPTPRLDESGCALLFERVGSGRVMRIDREGKVLWRLAPRKPEAHHNDLVPLADGGFAAAGVDWRDRVSNAVWIARYGYR